jgi:hypothetical protein
METNQPTVTGTKKSSFGPGSISFLAGVLLFLLPFVDIKCGGTTIKEVRGFELATGFTVEDKSMNQSIFGNMGLDQTIKSTKSEKRSPNVFALAALGLGVLGLIISFLAKGRSVPAAFMGVLAVVALIALMIDIKGDPKLNTGSNTSNSTDGFNANFDNDIIRVEFTPWFYITILVFLAAAFFCWRKKTSIAETTNAKPPSVEIPGGNG